MPVRSHRSCYSWVFSRVIVRDTGSSPHDARIEATSWSNHPLSNLPLFHWLRQIDDWPLRATSKWPHAIQISGLTPLANHLAAALPDALPSRRAATRRFPRRHKNTTEVGESQ